MSIFRPGRLLTVGVLAVIGLTVGAGIASAHVTVNPDTAVAGSYPKLTFRVPNESAKASTVKVTVKFPMDHPFASVLLEKEPGWTATVTTTKLSTPISDDDNASITQAVSSITWTADADGKIALGEFAEFDVSVGPVPKVASLSFDTTQSYDDGTVVHWNEPTPASGVEPENPAPVLTISPAAASTTTSSAGGATNAAAVTTAAAGGTTSIAAATTAAGTGSTSSAAGTASSGGGDVTGTAGATTDAAASTVAAVPTVTVAAAEQPAAVGPDNTARTLAVVGIIVGALGLLVAALALRNRPRVKQ
jgi:uncharacterized protein YcnI